MALWAVTAGVYGAVLTVAALAMPIARRPIAAAVCAAYALVAVGAGTLRSWFWVQLVVPGLLLLVGYWLSGFFFRDPQPWLERLLLESDRRLFRAIAVDRWLARAPTWVLEFLEASYTADYIVVAAGAIVTAFAGTDALVSYWSLVLTSELGCYLALPWLRSRPPRALESFGVMAMRAPLLRRLNVVILERASVHANTLPSGHVAGAVAAALAVMSVQPAAGWLLLLLASVIALGAVAGRYHYGVDCAAGASVALVIWLLL